MTQPEYVCLQILLHKANQNRSLPISSRLYQIHLLTTGMFIDFETD